MLFIVFAQKIKES